METDRSSLSEEYELLRAAGATDACYRSLLYRYTPSIIRIFQQVGLLRLKWVKKKYKKSAFAIFWYQTD